MYKVNMNHEVIGLKKNEIEFYQPLFTEGVLIERKNMSPYIRKCYKNSKILKWGVEQDLNYEFYLDKINNCCILFTECLVEECEDEFDLKDNFIVIKVYISPEDFMDSALAHHYRFFYTSNYLSSWGKFGYYTTNSSEYNEISIVIAISKLKPSKEIRPTNGLFN